MSNVNIVTDMKAAADYLGNGAIEVNMYEQEITDIVRRTSVALQRFNRKKATGHPHRYFEQTGIAAAGATDPRNIAATPSGATRVERSAMIKAIVGQTNFSLFDVEVTKQQGTFAAVEAQDIQDIVSGVQVYSAKQVWQGDDTSLTSPTTNNYVGLLTQITQQSTIAPGASIIDGLKAQVAAMVSNQTFNVRPTAIYLNGILGDYIDREAKAGKIELKEAVVAGVTVNAIATQAGTLPLIVDPFIPTATGSAYGFSAPPSGNKNYFAVIVTEDMVEMPVITGDAGNLNPRLFQLGLVGDLQAKYVGVVFDTVIAKGPSYAHATVACQRP